ncbi:hypothetical protein BDR07DRAFT_1438457 [Suillus spraguei]|nr:hypothetical protein BDR07DRAFT_1438457 [Suillus spraguei]
MFRGEPNGKSHAHVTFSVLLESFRSQLPLPGRYYTVWSFGFLLPRITCYIPAVTFRTRRVDESQSKIIIVTCLFHRILQPAYDFATNGFWPGLPLSDTASSHAIPVVFRALNDVPREASSAVQVLALSPLSDQPSSPEDIRRSLKATPGHWNINSDEYQKSFILTSDGSLACDKCQFSSSGKFLTTYKVNMKHWCNHLRVVHISK